MKALQVVTLEIINMFRELLYFKGTVLSCIQGKYVVCIQHTYYNIVLADRNISKY